MNTVNLAADLVSAYLLGMTGSAIFIVVMIARVARMSRFNTFLAINATLFMFAWVAGWINFPWPF